MAQKKEGLLFEGLFTGFRLGLRLTFSFGFCGTNRFHWFAATNYFAWFTVACPAWFFNRDNQPTFSAFVFIAFFICQKLAPLKNHYITLRYFILIKLSKKCSVQSAIIKN
jgi:hypothetical protein